MAKVECSVCSCGDNLETHHIDFNHKNNDLDNLITLCKRCHTIITQCGYTSREEIVEARRKIEERCAKDTGSQTTLWLQ